jgi:hypothetical protein
MRYLLMFYDDGDSRESMTEDDWESLAQGHVKFYHDVLSRPGRLVGSQVLEPPVKAITVRPLDGNVVITDGSQVPGKEWLAGFYLVDCESLEEAVEVAEQSPMPDGFGFVEVRPVMENQVRVSREGLKWK